MLTHTKNLEKGATITPFKLKFNEIEDITIANNIPESVSNLKFNRSSSIFNSSKKDVNPKASKFTILNSISTASTKIQSWGKDWESKSKTDDDCSQLLIQDQFMKTDSKSLRAMYATINEKMIRNQDKIKQKEELLNSLESSGYLMEETQFNNSKCKIKKISLLRNPINKEFPSMRNNKSPYPDSPKSTSTSSEYSILKKRRLSKSVKRVYTSEIEVEDYQQTGIRHFFKLYLDDDIGVTPKVQFEMQISVIQS